MADPWRILGLQRDTADEKKVRGAYAKLLKAHRPDQDPEGFQRLRMAYQYALEWIQQAAADLEDRDEDEADVEEQRPAAQPSMAETPKVPVPPLPSSWPSGGVPVLPDRLNLSSAPKTPGEKQRLTELPERSWPREWSYSLESLNLALRAPERQLDAIGMALKALATDVVEFGIPARSLACIIQDAFHADPGLFAVTAPASLLAWLLRGGFSEVLNNALDELGRSNQHARIMLMVQKLDDCLLDALSAGTADIFIRAAGLAALIKPFTAQSMARKMRRLLDSPAYSAQLDRLDAAIVRGLALRDVVPVQRRFWSQRMDQPAQACDWQAEIPAQALSAVVLLGDKWAGHTLVQSVVPADVWQAAWRHRWLKLTARKVSMLLQPRNLAMIGFAVVGGMLLLLGASHCTELSHARRSSPAARLEEDPEEIRRDMQRREELRRHTKELKQALERASPDSR